MSRPGWQSDLKNPCYDVEAKIDCSKRHGGCQFDCPEWDEYVEKRNKEYEKRKNLNEIGHVTGDSAAKRNVGYLKYKIRMARIKK